MMPITHVHRGMPLRMAFTSMGAQPPRLELPDGSPRFSLASARPQAGTPEECDSSSRERRNPYLVGATQR